jgi:hypothetical protein
VGPAHLGVSRVAALGVAGGAGLLVERQRPRAELGAPPGSPFRK